MAEEIKVTLNAEWLAQNVADLVYRQGKARMFNVLESQLSPEVPEERHRLMACKRLVEDILSDITRDVAALIRHTLDDWATEATAGGEVDADDVPEGFEEVIDLVREYFPNALTFTRVTEGN